MQHVWADRSSFYVIVSSDDSCSHRLKRVVYAINVRTFVVLYWTADYRKCASSNCHHTLARGHLECSHIQSSIKVTQMEELLVQFCCTNVAFSLLSFFLSFFLSFVFHYSGPVMSLFVSESCSKGRRKATVCHRAYNAVTGSSEWYSYLFQSHFAVFVTVLSGISTTSSYNLSNLVWHSSRYVTSSYKSSYITLMNVCIAMLYLLVLR